MDKTNEALTYQCPACSAGLSFAPDKQRFCCEYCLSEYTETEISETLAARAAEEEASRAAEAAAEAGEIPDEEYSASLGAYACSSCGAEVVCDETTVATECPYCHSPVILTGRLSGQLRPHKVIPFRFDREAAQQRFRAFSKKKWFVPRDFRSEAQLRHLSGIYYPFWCADADTSADMTARATRVRSWRQGEYRYTETSRFHVVRKGDIHFEDIVTPALTEEDRDMMDGILPYPSDSQKDFSAAYLSGFLAKRRNVEKEAVREAVRERMISYAKSLLLGTVGPYTAVTPTEPRLLTHRIRWDYTLMPVWLLTYSRRGKTYPYAMNGYTGKVYGRFPISRVKLVLLGVAVGAVFGVLAALFHRFVLP